MIYEIKSIEIEYLLYLLLIINYTLHIYYTLIYLLINDRYKTEQI